MNRGRMMTKKRWTRDEINHAKLPSAAIRAHSPGRRAHTSATWTHLRRIHKHDVSGHEMNADCTHVCQDHTRDEKESSPGA